MWESDELPDDIRRRVGMLKLAEIHTLVEDAGVRTNKGFVILVPEGFTFSKQQEL